MNSFVVKHRKEFFEVGLKVSVDLNYTVSTISDFSFGKF